MADDIGGAEEEKLRLGRYLLQIPAQEEVLTTTGIVDTTNQNISGGATYQFVNVDQLGFLEECLVVSPSTDFSLILSIDGNEAINKTYQGFNDITQTVKDISAFEELDADGNPTGKYIVHLTDIAFKVSLVISIKNNSGSPITFQNLFCKYRGGE